MISDQFRFGGEGKGETGKDKGSKERERERERERENDWVIEGHSREERVSESSIVREIRITGRIERVVVDIAINREIKLEGHCCG